MRFWPCGRTSPIPQRVYRLEAALSMLPVSLPSWVLVRHSWRVSHFLEVNQIVLKHDRSNRYRIKGGRPCHDARTRNDTRPRGYSSELSLPVSKFSPKRFSVNVSLFTPHFTSSGPLKTRKSLSFHHTADLVLISILLKRCLWTSLTRLRSVIVDWCTFRWADLEKQLSKLALPSSVSRILTWKLFSNSRLYGLLFQLLPMRAHTLLYVSICSSFARLIFLYLA